MSRHMQKDIQNLKGKLIDMSGVVEDRLYQATQSVVNRDALMAQAIINGDMEVDQMEVGVEEECLKILALYQPVAVDLRFIVASLKINNDLERIGDLAVNIAERAAYLAEREIIEMPFDVISMATKVENMVTRSIDALVNQDVNLAYRVRAEDDEVDTINREMFARVKEKVPESPEQFGKLLHAISVCRHLERIADHATNIAEEVIYLVKAEIIRHSPEAYKE